MARTRRTTRPAFALVLGGLLLAACGGGEPEAPATPDGWTSHEVGPATFAAPPGWTAQESDGALTVRESDVPSDPVVSVTVLTEPRPLQERVDGVWATARATLRAEKVDEGPARVPGARAATTLEYVADQPDADGGGTVGTRSRWLFAQLADGTTVMAVVSAADEEFDDDLATVLRTLSLS